MKNGTSEPTLAAISMMLSRLTEPVNRRERALSVDAASLEPPPRPAPMGMRFSMAIWTPGTEPALAAATRKAAAALYAVFLSAAQSQSPFKVMPPESRIDTETVSEIETAWNMLAIE
jgi:hypothetical protein